MLGLSSNIDIRANENFALDLGIDNQVDEEDEDDDSETKKGKQIKQFSKQNTSGQFFEAKQANKLSQKDTQKANIVTQNGTHHVNFETTHEVVAKSKHEAKQKPQSPSGNKGKLISTEWWPPIKCLIYSK